MKPICHDLYCGLGGWTEGFLSEGYEVFGYDIEKHDYGTGTYPGTLILCDVRSIHGSQLKDATVIVASPPCQEPSYRAMPWKRAKALNAAGPPNNFIELFNACFRIQREASEAAGRYIPLIVENVRGAERWVGSARWHFGSYYLWGDVPALMPPTKSLKNPGRNFHFPEKYGIPSPSFHGAAHERSVANAIALTTRDGIKSPGTKLREVGFNVRNAQRFRAEQGRKQGSEWWHDPNGLSRFYSRSDSRKAASAEIAKIPFPLAQHIARVFKPAMDVKTA